MQGFSNNHTFPQSFVPQPNIHYRIVSLKDPSKALTVTPNNHALVINSFTNDPTQRFTIVSQGNKYAFVVQAFNAGLCIDHDNNQNGGVPKADAGQHASSWFQIERVANGQFAQKGYALKTFAQGRCLAINGGNTNNGNDIIQWTWENVAHQIWLIFPADQIGNEYIPPQQNQGFFPNQNQNQGFSPNQSQGWGKNSEHGHHGHHGHKDHKQPKSGSSQGFGIQMQGSFKKNFSYALISCANESKCIHIANDNTAKIFDFQGTVNQKFVFEYDLQHKKYRIKCISNGQYLSGDGLFAGVAIKTKPKAENAELWNLQPSKDGKILSKGPAYSLRSFTGHAIDVPNNNFNNGTQLEKHGFHSAPNQTWYIIQK